MLRPEIEPRPRSAWEALDLGVLLARRHAALLMGTWTIVSLPLFVMLTALFWRQPTAAILLFWWLKPLLERLPLYILSRTLLGETPTPGQSLKALPGQLRKQWFAALTSRRLNARRSFELPVTQLEGLGGRERKRRLAILNRQDGRKAFWLTLAGMHLEAMLWMGLLTLLYVLLPQPLVDTLNWQGLLEQNDSNWLWMEHLSNLCYALVLIVWEPIYVACGFSLYLNQRTNLEGWDIEWVFRRLAQRLSGASGMLLAVALLTTTVANTAKAAEPNVHPPVYAQSLTPGQAKEQIRELLTRPPFQNRETVTRWRFTDQSDSQKDVPDRADLAKPSEWQNSLEYFAQLLEIGLRSALIILSTALLWYQRGWLRNVTANRRQPTEPRPDPNIRYDQIALPAPLPDDIAQAAERLWNEQPRQALGLLYRGMLERIGLPFKAAHTEAEILQHIATLQRPELQRFAETLIEHWQALAYGHRALPAMLGTRLCQDFRALFPDQSS
ncbi:hypothetical protein FHR87_002484 [Azomonas macrocytogenes]|uniref:Protein-glutamine gamma-glutamyltransferase-like C-terminal domain-containing protein n=2 Tax=Azomonas macrocytogenes TaxID=69962 RepID=A0A839T3T7_AZOMA|nr:DUF4129 domain-containing protein [Azomonas macrocytogenes]MBB3104072.1 hypothetical protein [Azomonas macrocytogenes]